jgi:hypothetical protein
MKILKQIENVLALYLEKLTLELESRKQNDIKNKWDQDTGEKFNNIINHYPVSENTLLYICKEFAEFNALTRIDSIKDYLFMDWINKTPRLPFMINRLQDYPDYCKYKKARCNNNMFRTIRCDECHFVHEYIVKLTESEVN